MTPSPAPCCPTCGQQIAPLQLFVCLESNVATRAGREVKLQPKQAEILHAMLERMPKVTSLPHLAAKVWGAGDSPDDEPQTLRVMIAQLRSRLASLSVRIKCTPLTGYRLVLDELPTVREVAA